MKSVSFVAKVLHPVRYKTFFYNSRLTSLQVWTYPHLNTNYNLQLSLSDFQYWQFFKMNVKYLLINLIIYVLLYFILLFFNQRMQCSKPFIIRVHYQSCNYLTLKTEHNNIRTAAFRYEHHWWFFVNIFIYTNNQIIIKQYMYEWIHCKSRIYIRKTI